MNTDHEQMARALRDLADRHGPSGPAPVTALLGRGRRRRRLRAATVASSATAVGALAVAGVVLGLGPAGGTASSSGPAGPAAASATTAPSPSSSPNRAVRAADVSGLLKTRIPAGYRPVGEWTPDPARVGHAEAAFTVLRGTRTGTVRIDVTHVLGVPAGGTYQPKATCGAGAVGCTSTTRPDGSVLMLWLGPAGLGGEQDWLATLYGTDGSMVTASSGTAPLPGQGTVLLEGPPLLDGDQLTALVLDPVWRQVAAVLPPPTRGGAGPLNR